MAKVTSRDAARDALRLARTHGIGPRSFARLIARYGSVTDALEALPAHPAARSRGIELPDWSLIDKELETGHRHGAQLLMIGDAAYPACLSEIADPPPVLWAKGRLDLLAEPGVAIVGARNASANGQRIAARLARELGEAGRIIVSGLARGIDGAAHEAALETGTVAAMAGGIDVVYPPQHARLAAAMAEQGLLLSEAPMGEQPTARHFPRRNRVVSGLSAGVVLIEAARRSGSLITARMALEQGREAMAVPGSPLDARCEGCNALIRDGAALIRDGADVIEALGRGATLRPGPARATVTRLQRSVSHQPAEPSPDGPADGVLALIGSEPVEIDALAGAGSLSAEALSALLLELELDGTVERLPGGRVVRVAP